MSSDKPISPETAITVNYENAAQACATLDALHKLLETYKPLEPVTQSKGVYVNYTNETIDALNAAKTALSELIQASSAALRDNVDAFRSVDERLAKQTFG